MEVVRSRVEALAQLRFPPLDRARQGSPRRAAMVAYLLGLGSLSGTIALVLELENARLSFDHRDYEGFPEWLARLLVVHTGPVLFLLLPIVISMVAVCIRDRGLRQLFACVGVLVSTFVVLLLTFALYAWGVRGGEDSSEGIGALILSALSLGVTIPFAPILHYADAEDSAGAGDRVEHARTRVNAWLALNMFVRLGLAGLVVLLVGEAENVALFMLPTMAVLSWSVVETIRAWRAQAATTSWIDRARKGLLPGVRVRIAAERDVSVVPPLVVMEPYADFEVVELGFDDQAVYRDAPPPLRLGTIPSR